MSPLNEAIPLLEVVASSPEISPDDISIPSPAVICALTSAADGPVYVNTPVLLLYANDPSPPASVADTAFFASLSARAVVKYLLVPSDKDGNPLENDKKEDD